MIGRSIGHFEITAKVGEGGMGVVYRATDTRLNREVAIKVLPEAFAADEQRMGRLEREAQVLASLSHPNIASIFGIEESEGTKALVMEMVEGEDLSERLRHAPPSIEEAAKIGLQIAAALESAHEKGVVHRDLKPANVKLTADGTAKVLDFGLAKAFESDASSSSADLTQSPTLSLAATEVGMILGTAGYMSPEQASGTPVDKRADIWSFGVVLFEMWSGGGPLFHGETASHTMADVLRADIDWQRLPSDLPRPLYQLLKRCLDRKPEHRLRDIGEARVVLEDYLADPEAAAGPQEPAATEAPSARRAMLPWLVAAGLAVGLAATGSLAWRAGSEPLLPPARFEAFVTEHDLFPFSGASVVLSPDGQRLVWTVDTGAGGVLYARELEQLAARELSRTTGLPNSPFFSPDGQWVGFFQAGRLLKVPFSGGSPQTICEIRGGRGGTWGANGTIVFADAGGGQLFKVSAAGGEPVALTEEDDIAERWPQFIPGQDAIVFSSAAFSAGTFANGNIETLRLDTGERKLLHSGGHYPRITTSGHLLYANNNSLFAVPLDMRRLELAGDPAPVVEDVGGNSNRGASQYAVSDNGHLVYVHGTSDMPDYPIVRVVRGGGTEDLWPQAATYGKPRFSPDGRKLAVTKLTDGNWDIWVFDLDRGTSTRLTFAEGLDTEQLWSPDGTVLVWSSDRDGIDNLYRKRSDGSGEIERLTESKEAQWATSWSHDGRYILYMVQVQGQRDLRVLDLESGDSEVYLATEFQDDYAQFSPDGRWIAYSSNESGRKEVYVRPFPMSGGKWQISDASGDQPLWGPRGRELFYRTDDGVMVAAIDGSGDSLVAGRPELVIEGDFRGGLGGINLGLLLFDDYAVAPDGQSFAFFGGDDTLAKRHNATFVLNWFQELDELFATD